MFAVAGGSPATVNEAMVETTEFIPPVLVVSSCSTMSLKSFPIIFINMGGEMVYILDQRLSAQEIVDQKAVKGRSTSGSSTYIALSSGQ